MTGPPRRRLPFRLRVALLCGIFLAGSGAALLCVNYLLMRAALPAALAEVVPVQPGPATSGVVHHDNPQAPAVAADLQASVLHTMLVQSLLALGVLLVLAVLLTHLVATWVTDPVRRIARAASALGVNDLGHRLRMTGPRDDLTDLADAFDALLDRLSGAFEAQRRFVAHASHELRTPLAAQRTLVEVAAARPGNDEATRELSRRLLVMNARVEALIAGMLVLARSDRGLSEKHPVALDDVVRTVVATWRPEMARRGLTLSCELEPRRVRGDAVLLEQLVTNLVQNAIKYNKAGGNIHIAVARRPALTVTNTGVPVPPETVRELFEPFRQLNGDGPPAPDRGTGLGLSIVESIARAHAGSVTATARPSGGLTVRVDLPPAG